MTTMTAPKLPKMKSILGWKVLHLYVDPHPGKHNSDRIPVDCGKCGGSGYIRAFSHVEGGVCFECEGHGKTSISVGTLRQYAKADAFSAEYGEEIDAYWAEFEAVQQAARKAEEFAQAWDDAHAEAAKRAAMVGGFIGEVGEQLRGKGLVGTVVFEKHYDAGFGYHKTTGKFMIIEMSDGKIAKVAGTGGGLFVGAHKGDQVAILGGSVKAHENFRGQDQSVLQRVKLELIESDDEEV